MAEPTIIAFDLDNTLLDPDMRAYRNTLSRTLESVDLGLAPGDAFDAFESSRAAGHAFERLGLQNPIHERGCPHGLAGFWLLHCVDDAQRQALGICRNEQPQWREALLRLNEWDRRTKTGSLDSRLAAERRTRTICQSNDDIRRFREEVVRLADHPTILEASHHYETIEASQAIELRTALMETLVARGFTPVIITEGRSAIQEKKVARCGLDHSWLNRVLITEEAANVPGLGQLEESLSHRLAAESADPALPPSPELSNLWHYRCLIDAWAHKTPWFFGRCLQAIQLAPESPRTMFQPPIRVDNADWTPFRFVMVGDRYNKDIEPVIDLLGPDIGFTVRLRMGKYAKMHPQESMVQVRRPGMTYTDWQSLSEFLLDELSVDAVPPIRHTPRIVNRDLITPRLIEFGKKSGLDAVLATAKILDAAMDGTAPHHA